MTTPLDQKSSLEDIQQRFDHDVARFSNLESGQAATIDAPLAMELITKAAAYTTQNIRRVLDIGCGAGNTTLKLLQYINDFDCDLVDLSSPMLKKARERIIPVIRGKVTTIQGDFRSVDVSQNTYDIILAAAVLHHLRTDQDWEDAFTRLFSLLTPGGSLWITDLVTHESDGVHNLMWKRYGEYLTALGGTEYQKEVFAYIDREDSPRPVTYQLKLLRKVGFKYTELLHKNCCFAAFGAIKSL